MAAMSNWTPIKIAYSVTEPSTGSDGKLAPIILLHGMTRTKEDWNNLDQALADATHRKIYKLDARNHGDSEWSDVFDFEILGDDVNHFMDQHKIRKAILIGHSMGGRTAMEVAGKYPEKVEKIIIEDMTPLSIEGDFVTGMRGLLLLKVKCLDMIPAGADLAEGQRIITEFMLDKIMEVMKDSVNEQTRENYHIEIDLAKSEEGGFRWKTNYELIASDRILYDMLRKKFDKVFNGDALFICGTKSLFRVMDSKDEIVKMFPKATIKEVVDATHMVHGEYPKKFIELSVEFIQGS